MKYIFQRPFKKYSKDEFPEVIEVKYSMLKNGVLGFIFTVLGVTILKEILNTEIGSFSQIFSYAFPLLLTEFGFYPLQKVLSKKVAVEINHEGISCGEKFYKWSEIKFTYFGLGGNQRYPILRLYVMLKDSETPILLHDDLRWIN